MLPPETLYFQMQRHANESIDQLTNRLARHYSWTDEEKRLHRSHLIDIQTARNMDVIAEKAQAPHSQDLAGLDAYLAALDRRAEAALVDLDELEDLDVN